MLQLWEPLCPCSWARGEAQLALEQHRQLRERIIRAPPQQDPVTKRAGAVAQWSATTGLVPTVKSNFCRYNLKSQPVGEQPGSFEGQGPSPQPPLNRGFTTDARPSLGAPGDPVPGPRCPGQPGKVLLPLGGETDSGAAKPHGRGPYDSTRAGAGHVQGTVGCDDPGKWQRTGGKMGRGELSPGGSGSSHSRDPVVWRCRRGWLQALNPVLTELRPVAPALDCFGKINGTYSFQAPLFFVPSL